MYHGGIEGRNSFSGVGLMIEESLHPHFSRISDRISKADFKLKDHQVNIIAAYDPTLTKSEEDPKLREGFYDELEVVTANT